MDEVLAWLNQAPPDLALVLVFVAALSEYVVPPLPADTVVLAASLLVVAGLVSFTAVFAAAVAGGVAGSAVGYVAGRWLAEPGGHLRYEPWIERLTGKGSTKRFLAAFRRHGLGVVAFNRIFPGVRAVTFVAAGAARLPPGPVLAVGALSQAGWTLLMLGIGVRIGRDWENIKATFSVYRDALFVAGGLGLVLFVAMKVWQRQRSA